MHDLVERPVTSEYRYNMSCPDCPGITALTGAEYYSERNDAHVQCAHCGGDIHFCPAVMARRDAGDAVLDDQWAFRVAWYHTSTDPGWPSGARPMPSSAVDLLKGTMPPGDGRQVERRPDVGDGLDEPKDSVVNVTTLVTLDKTHLDTETGQLPASLMNDVDRGLRRVLGL